MVDQKPASNTIYSESLEIVFEARKATCLVRWQGLHNYLMLENTTKQARKLCSHVMNAHHVVFSPPLHFFSLLLREFGCAL